MSAVQEYQTDALQVHVDSTPVLIRRLEQWSRAVGTVLTYANGQLHVQSSVTSALEKVNKQLAQEVPEFADRTGLSTSQAGAAAGTEASGRTDVSLGNVFNSIKTSSTNLLQKSTQTAQAIKSNVIPPLEQLQGEVEKHHKALRSQGGKGIKDIEKTREVTQKLVEQLGRVTSSYGSRGLDHKDDPYVIKRRVKAAVYDQVGIENKQAEAALNVQRTFASLENHILDVMRTSLNTLEQLQSGFASAQQEVGSTITTQFSGVNLKEEWAYFTKTNSDSLVPEENYQRDADRVTFNNENHVSTKPIIEGTLQRKGTALKQYHSGYYVVTPSGYLHQFKSASPQQDSTPELSLFLPDCQLSGNSMDFTFRVVGKGANKVLSTRHKYSFKTASQAELDAWYHAIARVTGQQIEEGPGSPAPESPAGGSPVPGSPAQTGEPGVSRYAAEEPPTSELASTQVASPESTSATAPNAVPFTAQAPANTGIPATGSAPTHVPGPTAAPGQAPIHSQAQAPTQAPSQLQSQLQTQVPTTSAQTVPSPTNVPAYAEQAQGSVPAHVQSTINPVHDVQSAAEPYANAASSNDPFKSF